jgi:hypothetical protein
VLRRLGLDPDHDVQPVVMTPGDYGRHLRKLAEGSLDAAFVGSTLAPEVAAQRSGLRLLAFVGDNWACPPRPARPASTAPNQLARLLLDHGRPAPADTYPGPAKARAAVTWLPAALRPPGWRPPGSRPR